MEWIPPLACTIREEMEEIGPLSVSALSQVRQLERWPFEERLIGALPQAGQDDIQVAVRQRLLDVARQAAPQGMAQP